MLFKTVGMKYEMLVELFWVMYTAMKRYTRRSTSAALKLCQAVSCLLPTAASCLSCMIRAMEIALSSGVSRFVGIWG